MDETIEMFFDSIFADHRGVISLGLITGDRPENPRAIDNAFFWNWPDQRSDVLQFARRHTTEDVYVSPMLYSQRERKAEYVTHTPAIWCDADDAAPEMFELEPTLAVETSPNRWHLYWVLDEKVTPTWAAKMSKIVAYRHRDEGAGYEGWQLSKYLRVPGCTNTKPELLAPFPVALNVSGRVYSAQELADEYGDPASMRNIIAGPVQRQLPKDLPTVADVLSRLTPDNDVSRMLYETPGGPSWNETLWALECILFRKGLQAEDVFTLVHGCACDKYARDGRPDTDLWGEILKAERNAPFYDPDSTPNVISAESYSPPPVARPAFISDEEALQMQDYPTFIDRYTEWGRTRTEADPRYHELGAMCLLSTVLSDFGHAVPMFGDMKLNMWFMLLGVTTRTYKTTSRKLMLEILNPLHDPDNGYEYKMGSDATPEALLAELAQHPNRSTLFFRDEVSGLFGEMRGGRAYMSGIGETMTELFDGHVHGRLRASGSNRKTPEVTTAFNLYLMGVPNKVAEILNADDFATGFLARFIYVIGEPGARTRDSMYLAQQPRDFTKMPDPAATALRAELADVRYYWERQTGVGTTMPIYVTDRAWERFNEFIVTMTELAAGEAAPEILEPCSDRLNKAALKLACLLAMMDKQDEVQLHHMIRAIWYAEGWYTSMVQMSQMIQTSQWSAKVDELVTFVSRTEQVKYTNAYRKFRDMKSKEFGELVASAVECGMLRVREDESRTRWLTI